MELFDHLIKIDAQQRVLHVYRVLNNGKQELYTSYKLPKSTNCKEYKKFIENLGEGILLDSPLTRKLLDL